jgi:hypothetical protein
MPNNVHRSRHAACTTPCSCLPACLPDSHVSRELPLTMRTLTRVSLTQGPDPCRMRPSCLASRMHSPPRVVHEPCRQAGEGGGRGRGGQPDRQ